MLTQLHATPTWVFLATTPPQEIGIINDCGMLIIINLPRGIRADSVVINTWEFCYITLQQCSVFSLSSFVAFDDQVLYNSDAHCTCIPAV